MYKYFIDTDRFGNLKTLPKLNKYQISKYKDEDEYYKIFLYIYYGYFKKIKSYICNYNLSDLYQNYSYK